MSINETAKIILSKKHQEEILSDEDYAWVSDELIVAISNDGNWLVDFDDIGQITSILADFEIEDFEIVDADEGDMPTDEHED